MGYYNRAVTGDKNDILRNLEELFNVEDLEGLFDWLKDEGIVKRFQNEFEIRFDTEEERKEAMDKVWKRIEDAQGNE